MPINGLAGSCSQPMRRTVVEEDVQMEADRERASVRLVVDVLRVRNQRNGSATADGMGRGKWGW